MPRRVAVLSVHTSPLAQPGTGDAGGMNVYVLELSRRLAARGVEVYVSYDGFGNLVVPPRFYRQLDPRIHVFRLPAFARPIWRGVVRHSGFNHSKIMVVDDEALVRSGLRMILGSAADVDVVATCEGAEAVEEIRRHRPDVVLLDIRMPEVDGLAVLREVIDWPDPPVVAMLTTFHSDEFVAEALGAGAVGFLLKDTEPAQLIAAVRALANGGAVLSPAVTRTVINGYRDRAGPPESVARVEAMSPREREVLGLLGLGLSNAEIGRRLYLSTATVKDYVSAVLAGLGVTNRVQAAVVAQEAGIVPVEDEGP